jgi:hypothetical protein
MRAEQAVPDCALAGLAITSAQAIGEGTTDPVIISASLFIPSAVDRPPGSLRWRRGVRG